MRNLSEIINKIGDLDAAAMAAAQERQNQLTKPQGSLGVLEQLSIKLAGMRGTVFPKIAKKVVVVMAADHGVTEEGISAYPSEVTAQMVYNFTSGGAAINVLAAHQGAEIIVVDMGVKSDIDDKSVLVKKIRRGTANITKGPAMTRTEAEEAVLSGIEVAGSVVDSISNNQIDGSTVILAIGDMGIGNTTSSSALVSVLGGFKPKDVVGLGTGINSQALEKKIAVIDQAIKLNQPDVNDPMDVLAKIGGLEIAGLAGVVIGSAALCMPVIVDGFISSAAALVASRLAPKSINYMIASHLSIEPGHKYALAEVGLSPMLHMDMRLGEGTGAVLAMNIVEAATKIISEMATFADAGVSTKNSEKKVVIG